VKTEKLGGVAGGEGECCAGAGVLYLQPSCVCRLETGQGAGCLESYLRMFSRWDTADNGSQLAG